MSDTEYWVYLLNSSNKTCLDNLLTFENQINNLNKLIIDYCELINDNFFSSFYNYDYLFISIYSPLDDVINKKKEFFIKLDNLEKANLILKKIK